MIPRAHITAWRASPPRSLDEHVEQVLVLSPAELGAKLEARMADPRFLEDVAPLLAPGSPWDIEGAARYARAELLVRLPGDAWRGEGQETEQEE